MSEDEQEKPESKMNWPLATVEIFLILAIVAIVFIVCGAWERV